MRSWNHVRPKERIVLAQNLFQKLLSPREFTKNILVSCPNHYIPTSPGLPSGNWSSQISQIFFIAGPTANIAFLNRRQTSASGNLSSQISQIFHGNPPQRIHFIASYCEAHQIYRRRRVAIKLLFLNRRTRPLSGNLDPKYHRYFSLRSIAKPSLADLPKEGTSHILNLLKSPHRLQLSHCGSLKTLENNRAKTTWNRFASTLLVSGITT